VGSGEDEGVEVRRWFAAAVIAKMLEHFIVGR
jgi:hypothetical protein